MEKAQVNKKVCCQLDMVALYYFHPVKINLPVNCQMKTWDKVHGVKWMQRLVLNCLLKK